LSRGEGHAVEPLRFDEKQKGFIPQLANFQYFHGAIAARNVAPAVDDGQDERSADALPGKPTWQDILDFARTCKSPALAFLLLREATGHGRSPFVPLGPIAAAYDRLEQRGLSSYALRYERACTLHDIDRKLESRRAFEKLYRDAIARGGLPPVDARFVKAFDRTGPSRRKFEHLIKETGQTLLDQRRFAQVFLQMSQFRQLDEDNLARELLSHTLASVSEEDRFAVTLMAVAHLVGIEQYRRADSMLQSLLDNEEYGDLPELWQLAAQVANQRGMLARSLACEETSLDLKLGKLTNEVDVTHVRSSHGKLLKRYEQLAHAVATLGDQPSTELVGRVVRIADRWRSLDDDATGACQAAAKVLQAAGDDQLAWDYLTTPLALKPNEAVAWRDLAASLAEDQEYELADRAYTAAFEAEPTNAEILWDRIELLQEAGRQEDANRLLQQLADGDWQPRFQRLQRRAADLISQ
jgi:tetratricopeptide (TPR) repeat protein